VAKLLAHVDDLYWSKFENWLEKNGLFLQKSNNEWVKVRYFDSDNVINEVSFNKKGRLKFVGPSIKTHLYAFNYGKGAGTVT